MKALIWIGCIVVGVVLNTLLIQVTGVGFGQVLLLLIIIYAARKLCEVYDKQKNADKARKADAQDNYNYTYTNPDMNPDNTIHSTAPNTPPTQEANPRYCMVCGEQLRENNGFCPKCGAKVQ